MHSTFFCATRVVVALYRVFRVNFKVQTTSRDAYRAFVCVCMLTRAAAVGRVKGLLRNLNAAALAEKTLSNERLALRARL